MKSKDYRRITFTFIEAADLLGAKAKEHGFVLPDDYTFVVDKEANTISFSWQEETDHG